MKLFATLQSSILSLVSNPEIEKRNLNKHSLYQVLSRKISAREKFRILIPYRLETTPDPLLAMGLAAELVYLNDKREKINKQTMPRANGRCKIIFPDENLRTFRAPADFDLIFCSLLHIEGETDRISEDLCHCRMLLKPGGYLFLHVQEDKSNVFMEKDAGEKDSIQGMLARAGLTKIVKHRLSHGEILCSGQRPSFHA